MLDKLAKVGVIVIASGLLVGTVAYFVTRETPRQMGAAFEEVARKASREFASSIPVQREINDVLFLIVQRQNRDEERQFREILTRDVSEKAKYRLKTWDEVLSKLSGLGDVLRGIGLIQEEPPNTIEAARKAVKALATTGMTIDGVLVCRVTEFEQGDRGLGSRITLEGELHNVKDSKAKPVVLGKTSEGISSSLDYRYLSNRLAEVSFVARFLGWFAIAAGLPFLLRPVVVAVVSKRRNDLNVALLAGLTLVDVAAGWVLLVSMGFGWGVLVLLLLLAAAMAYYNHDAAEYMDKWMR